MRIAEESTGKWLLLHCCTRPVSCCWLFFCCETETDSNDENNNTGRRPAGRYLFVGVRFLCFLDKFYFHLLRVIHKQAVSAPFSLRILLIMDRYV